MWTTRWCHNPAVVPQLTASPYSPCPSEVQHVRSCPIDCATIYYNGVRRSGLYTVVPAHGGMPVEVYCDMDTDGQWPQASTHHSGH